MLNVYKEKKSVSEGRGEGVGSIAVISTPGTNPQPSLPQPLQPLPVLQSSPAITEVAIVDTSSSGKYCDEERFVE